MADDQRFHKGGVITGVGSVPFLPAHGCDYIIPASVLRRYGLSIATQLLSQESQTRPNPTPGTPNHLSD